MKMKHVFLGMISFLMFTATSCSGGTSTGSSGPVVSTSEVAETYSVTINAMENGSVTADKQTVSNGGMVTLTVVPNEGYTLDSLKVNNETVSVEDNSYTVFNVSSNITVDATFVESKITVKFYNGDQVLYTKKAEPGSTFNYVGETPTKEADGTYFYEFSGWYLTNDFSGSKVTEFVFNVDTNLYAKFDSNEITFTVEENVILELLDTHKINYTTNISGDVAPTYVSLNEEIATVARNGVITPMKAGTCDIKSTLSGIERITHVTINSANSPYIANKVYGSGTSTQMGDVSYLNSVQADIEDKEGNKAPFYEFFEYSCDVLLKDFIPSSGNFGLAFYMNRTASGGVSKAYQFYVCTDVSNNVSIRLNGSVMDGTTATAEINPNQRYNLKVVTSPKNEDKIHIDCYIDNVLVTSADGSKIPNAPLYGIRLKDAVDCLITNVKIVDKTPEYNVLTAAEHGVVTSNKATVKYGESCTLTVTPDENYALKSLKINNVDRTNDVVNGTLVLDEVKSDINVEASFVRLYNFTVANVENGRVEPGSGVYQEGEQITIKCFPNEGYMLDQLYVNDSLVTYDSEYVIAGINEDINVVATFKLIPVEQISVKFYKENQTDLIDTIAVDKGATVTPPSYILENTMMHDYEFNAWYNLLTGERVTNFVFEEDTSLYANFNVTTYEINVPSANLSFAPLEQYQLVPTTTSPYEVTYSYQSSDTSVLEVSATGLLTTKINGSAKITISCDGVSKEVLVDVGSAEGFVVCQVFGEGKTFAFEDGVFNMNSEQSDIFDTAGNKLQLKYIDIELNVFINSSIGKAGNYGFQICKTESDSGGVKLAYQFKIMTTNNVATGNIQLVKNAKAISGVDNKTVQINPESYHKVRIVTSYVSATATRIQCYLDGELMFDYTDQSAIDGYYFGFRCASLADAGKLHLASIVSIKDNSPE